MTQRYYAESDGDGAKVGHYAPSQSDVFYVIDRETDKRVAENFKSMAAAKSYAITWNELEEGGTKNAK